MKLFIIFNYQCQNDITKFYKSLEDAKNHYDNKTLIVEAPDYVFENWGFDASKSGDERFVQPVPPDGWLYDNETGTYYPKYTNEQKRKQCYETGTVVKEDVDFHVEWNGELYTLDQLSQIGLRYEFRGNTERAEEVKKLVLETFAKINEKYPD